MTVVGLAIGLAGCQATADKSRHDRQIPASNQHAFRLLDELAAVEAFYLPYRRAAAYLPGTRKIDPYNPGAYTYEPPGPGESVQVTDDGQVWFHQEGRKPSVSPVASAQYALYALDHGKNDKARTAVKQLLETAEDGFFPYRFRFAIRVGGVEQHIPAPWFSAIAQGQMLSVFSRLYRLTGRRYWLARARETFGTLKPLKRRRWVSFVDSSRHVWFEEYPLPDRSADQPRVFNGHMFAMFGLYDYWKVTGSEDAANLFAGGATTIAYYARYPYLIRGPRDWAPAYGVGANEPSAEYRELVIKQLRILSRITGSDVFAQEARDVESGTT